MSWPELLAQNMSIIESVLPRRWQELAEKTGALKGLRRSKSKLPLYCLGMLLPYLAGSGDLAKCADDLIWTKVSPVTLLERLYKAKDWLRELSRELLQEMAINSDFPWSDLILLDSFLAKEPGRTGYMRFVEFGLRWPSLECCHFEIDTNRSRLSDERLPDYKAQKGELIVLCSQQEPSAFLLQAQTKGAFVTAMARPETIICTADGRRYPVEHSLPFGREVIELRHHCVKCITGEIIRCRVFVIQQSAASVALEANKKSSISSRSGHYYHLVISTFPKPDFSTLKVLDAFNTGWRFSRATHGLVSCIESGAFPKGTRQHPERAVPWLYGKLFVTLLLERMVMEVRKYPWGHQAALHSLDAK